ncbi:uncharacterized protein LOC6586334 isoform X3 [Drosophila mojavensis]|uniref:Uncharacterized protein, isoform D n=1 Tax=Drosophila mojavensis TaxID=7230 RepID=A0A0Q9XGH9_DROMO|nr:uncharacterized protein LOC6586334 isoform X3 [Drosophila mojavensis]KRG07596.1 uncharacterized protein Dmoj_GI14476, isoform D [Drosophila mojavensis]
MAEANNTQQAMVSSSEQFNGRHSASPARTIDSHDSTTGSMDTIVDRSLNRNNLLQVTNTIEQNTNATNDDSSLTNSQIAILRRDSQQGQQKQEQVEQDERQHVDAQSHIYSSPVYDEKPSPPLMLTAATLLANALNDKDDQTKKSKLISHEEFKHQLEEASIPRTPVKSVNNTIDSRISKKQRCPPEFIKYKGSSGNGTSDNEANGSTLSAKARHKHRASNECCSAFPLQIMLGTLQLVLAISLMALGSLLIVRDTALSMAGIWTGLIAAITGSLGVVSMRKTQTAFLALSLVCIASSTLALAISGVGLSRDLNRMAEQKSEQFDLMNAHSEVPAACGLIFVIFLHFLISIVSVYRCALQICTKSQPNELRDVIKSSESSIALDQQKADQYIKATSLNVNEKVNNKKLAALWMYATHIGTFPLPQKSGRKLTPASRSIMLIPATVTGNVIQPRMPPSLGASMLQPAHPPHYRGMTLPHLRPPVLYAHPVSLTDTYRANKSTKLTEFNEQRRRGRAVDNSETDVLSGAQNFQYTGMDRAIADSFLERQEQSQFNSHIDYSSSSSSMHSDVYRQKAAARSHTSSKAKIVCRDVMI